MTPTVHVLAYGRALCGSVHGIPAEWGAGHRWVSAFGEEWKRDATCVVCREQAKAMEAVHDSINGTGFSPKGVLRALFAKEGTE